MCLVKYNSTGDYQWDRTWGGSDIDFGAGIVLDSSENIYITGSTESFGAGDRDMYLVKYNNLGDYQWNRTCGGSNLDHGEAITLDSSDNIYIVGITNSFEAVNGEMYLVKYDSLGVKQWDRPWGGNYPEVGEGITFDPLGNLYFVGYTMSFGAGDYDICLVKYDLAAPQITINSPNQNELVGSVAPDFDLSIVEENLGTIWYTIDGGTTNFICGLSGQIDQTEWNKKLDGSVTIRFYAQDNKGNEGHAEVTVLKDTIAPNITINSPIQDQEFGSDAPTFNITITELNLDTMWYVIVSNETTKRIITSTIGSIDISVWNPLADGTINIRFYANDTTGNTSYSEVSIVKDTSEPTPSPEPLEIPGFNVIITLSVIFLVSIVIITGKKKLLNFK